MKEKIIGKNIIGSRRKEAIQYIEKQRKNGQQELKGEYKKDSMEIKFIEMIDNVLEKELKKMGINKKKHISPKQVHLLKDVVYQKECGKSMGEHKFFVDGIYINKDKIFNKTYNPRVEYLRRLLHEIIHSYAHTKIHVNYDADIQHQHFTAYRSGYKIENPRESEHEHFRGFNEAITEMITSDIESKYFEKILEKLNFSREEISQVRVGATLNSIYEIEQRITREIIKKVAKYKNEDEWYVWRRMVRGYFTGEMMHLRDIEKACGKGSLRVLAALRSGTINNPPVIKFMTKINNKILEYFKSDDGKEKEKIARYILNEREKIKYLERKKVDKKEK